MTAHLPPRLAVFILDYFLAGDEPLTGDLLEAARTRSRCWFWGQVLLAVVIRALSAIRGHTRVTVETVLVGTAMLALLAFHAVVAASLVNRLWLMSHTETIAAGVGRYEGWHTVAAMVAFLVAIAVGRAIGRFHREHRLAAAGLSSVSAVAAAFVNLSLFVPQSPIQPAFMPPGAEVQIVESMLFIAGLFIGIATSPGQIRSSAIAARPV